MTYTVYSSPLVGPNRIRQRHQLSLVTLTRATSRLSTAKTLRSIGARLRACGSTRTVDAAAIYASTFAHTIAPARYSSLEPGYDTISTPNYTQLPTDIRTISCEDRTTSSRSLVMRAAPHPPTLAVRSRSPHVSWASLVPQRRIRAAFLSCVMKSPECTLRLLLRSIGQGWSTRRKGRRRKTNAPKGFAMVGLGLRQ